MHLVLQYFGAEGRRDGGRGPRIRAKGRGTQTRNLGKLKKTVPIEYFQTYHTFSIFSTLLLFSSTIESFLYFYVFAETFR